jgi:hypothetical protein
MKMILVRGYKDFRIERYTDPEKEPYIRGGRVIDINQAHDAYELLDASSAINAAIKEIRYREDQIISVTAVPSQTNERDPGSTDYYVALRGDPWEEPTPDF